MTSTRSPRPWRRSTTPRLSLLPPRRMPVGVVMARLTGERDGTDEDGTITRPAGGATARRSLIPWRRRGQGGFRAAGPGLTDVRGPAITRPLMLVTWNRKRDGGCAMLHKARGLVPVVLLGWLAAGEALGQAPPAPVPATPPM